MSAFERPLPRHEQSVETETDGHLTEVAPGPRHYRTAPEPPYTDGGGGQTTLASAVRRHPFLTVLPMLALLAAGIVFGAKRHPTYSATATINVGKSDINTQATPGYVQAAEALATTYSRLVTSQHISIPAAAALHESPTAVGANLSSVPIPSQPTFTITATGRSPQAAVKLSNAAVRALQRFVNHSQTQRGGASQLLGQFAAAQATASRLQDKSNTLQGLHAAQTPGITQARVTQAQVASKVASLQAQVLANEYTSLMSTGSAPTLDVLISATGVPTTNNRTTNIEKYGVIGAAGGLVIGIAFAALVAGLGARRRRARTG
jgi:capsular polysaccharide biosynthesis protein